MPTDSKESKKRYLMVRGTATILSKVLNYEVTSHRSRKLRKRAPLSGKTTVVYAMIEIKQFTRFKCPRRPVSLKSAG